MNYRKKYEQYLGIKLSLEFEVHHIDHDRNNNDFSNLVAIPKDMHRQYHKLFTDYEKEKYMRDCYTPHVKTHKEVLNYIEDMKRLIKQHGFHSVTLFHFLQDLSTKAIDPIQSKGGYEKYCLSCKRIEEDIRDFKDRIKSIKKQQDKKTQKLLVKI